MPPLSSRNAYNYNTFLSHVLLIIIHMIPQSLGVPPSVKLVSSSMYVRI